MTLSPSSRHCAHDSVSVGSRSLAWPEGSSVALIQPTKKYAQHWLTKPPTGSTPSDCPISHAPASFRVYGRLYNQHMMRATCQVPFGIPKRSAYTETPKTHFYEASMYVAQTKFQVGLRLLCTRRWVWSLNKAARGGTLLSTKGKVKCIFPSSR